MTQPRYVGRLTRTGGHLEDPRAEYPEDWRHTIRITGRIATTDGWTGRMTVSTAGGSVRWAGECRVTGDTLRAEVRDQWGSGLDIDGTRDVEGFALAAEGWWSQAMRVPLIDDDKAA